MRAYVAHYKKLAERKAALEERLKDSDLDVRWVEYEPTSYILNKYTKSKSDWLKKVSPFVNQYGEVPFRELKRSEISLLYKHIIILCDIMFDNESKDDYALVLEDDVVLADDFEKQIKEVIKEASRLENWDAIFLGNGCNLRISPKQLRPGQRLYNKNHPAAKCTDSFLIKKSAAIKVYSNLNKFVLPIDFELNYWFWALNMDIYWLEPPIVQQGSQNGLYKSEIQ